jgi:hypothetical protein
MMKMVLSLVVILLATLQNIPAQDSLIVIARMTNTQISSHPAGNDTLIVISTLGEPIGGIRTENNLVISFEPFPFAFLQGPSAVRNLPRIDDLHIFPNPARDHVVLQREKVDQTYSVEIYSLEGFLQKQFSWEAGSSVLRPPLHQYPPGMYILRVYDALLTKASQYRMIIQ